jgi:hypothetical protein
MIPVGTTNETSITRANILCVGTSGRDLSERQVNNLIVNEETLRFQSLFSHLQTWGSASRSEQQRLGRGKAEIDDTMRLYYRFLVPFTL